MAMQESDLDDLVAEAKTAFIEGPYFRDTIAGIMALPGSPSQTVLESELRALVASFVMIAVKRNLVEEAVHESDQQQIMIYLRNALVALLPPSIDVIGLLSRWSEYSEASRRPARSGVALFDAGKVFAARCGCDMDAGLILPAAVLATTIMYGVIAEGEPASASPSRTAASGAGCAIAVLFTFMFAVAFFFGIRVQNHGSDPAQVTRPSVNVEGHRSLTQRGSSAERVVHSA